GVRVRRRRVIAAATSIGGAGLLGISLSTEAGSPQFYALTLGLAGTWAAGALAVGPWEPGRSQGLRDALRRQVAGPVVTRAGAGPCGLFSGAAGLPRFTPPLDRAVGSALHYADHGSTRLVPLTAGVNAVAEELFFRGALWSLVEESSPIARTTLAYAATVAAT